MISELYFSGGRFPSIGRLVSPLSLIAAFGTRTHYYFPLQHSFSLGLHYFREELQGWFQYTIWGEGFPVKVSAFHLESLLEEASFLW